MADAELAKALSDLELRPSTRSYSLKNGETGRDLRKLTSTTNKFMENFNPETSARERRKLNRKINATGPKKSAGVLYDENGIHIATGRDLCDCLTATCPGCFFPCPKCTSSKCGAECRNNRKYIYDQIDYEGCNINVKNPLGK